MAGRGGRAPARRRRSERPTEPRRRAHPRPSPTTAPPRRPRRRPRSRVRARPDRRVHLRPDLARLPGDVDPPARLGDRQHDLRLHDDPGDVPHRDRASGPCSSTILRTRLGDPIRLLAASQVVAAALAIAGPRPRPGRSRTRPTPNKPLETLQALFRSSLLVVLPVTIALGIAFPASSALLADDAVARRRRVGRAARDRTRRRDPRQPARAVRADPAARLAGPRRGPARWSTRRSAIVLGLALRRAGRARSLDRGDRRRGRCVVIVVAIASVPGVLVQPNEAYIASAGGRLFDSTEDEIASVQAGQITFTPELWVAGHVDDAAHRRRQADAGPAAHRPARVAKRALVVAFGMGSAFRGALIAGLQTDAVELVPSVPEDVRLVLPRRRRGPRRPERPGHHHRRPEPPRADRRALRHHRHRPAAADRELRRLGHLVAASTTRPAATT